MFKRQLIFLEFVSSIVNPANKLYSLAYKVQQTFFVPAIKTWISEQHDKSFWLTKYYSYWNVFYLVKMHNLSRNGSGQGIKFERSYNHHQNCWEGCPFNIFFFFLPPAPGPMLIKTLMFVRIIVLLYPNIEWGHGGSLAKDKTLFFQG